MNRRREADDSRQGLLRKSLDDAYRSSSETDIDLTEFLAQDPPEALIAATSQAYKPGNRMLKVRRKRSWCKRILIAFLVIIILIAAILGGGGFWLYNTRPVDGQSPPWYPTPLGGTISSWSESYAKAAKLVKSMSLIEKVNITTGTGWQMGLAVGNTGPALNAGFPGLALQDGPLGIRFADHATAFPAGITVGATWNKTLMYARGKAHGMEARLKGVNILLGPCVGPLGRMPAAGRNWEGFGADPYLQGVAGAETIRGIQEQGVMATIKHFVGNEQEHYRQAREWGLPNALSANIADRTMHELYMWPFADAVKQGVASVMCSYQLTNNSYSCGNSKLLNGLLKDELGFQGFVMSDWLAARSGVSTALAGLDMMMPGDGLTWAGGDSLWGSKLTIALLNGSLPMSRLNDMVTRVVASWYQLGQDDESKFDRKGPNFSSWTNNEKGRAYTGSPDDSDLITVNQFVDVQGNGTDAHSIIARQVAAEGTVLLKNNGGILPLSRNGWPINNPQNKTYRVGIYGDDAGPGQGPNYCVDRGCNQGTLGSGWGSGAVEFPYLVTPASAIQQAFNNPDKVRTTAVLTNSPDLQKQESIVTDQDLCIVFVNADSGEGYLSTDGILGDRNDLYLQKDGDALVTSIASRCGNGTGETIVVVHAVGVVVMERWIDLPGVKAVILANLPGQESGNALVDIMFGDVNPSGKLPYTIGKSLDDYGDGGQVMYLPNAVLPQQDFAEGIYIDYRHFDKFGIQPRFEFGYGLSYTQFQYGNLKITPVQNKSRLPSPRPTPLSPPTYDETIPDRSTALFPAGFRKLSKFIYPYINSIRDINVGPYPYPDGYDIKQSPSQAGGGEGGNPSLYDIYVTVSVDITNTGSVSGAEVAQLYLSYPGSPAADKPLAGGSSVNFDLDMSDFPVRVLRGFEKVMIDPGKTATAQFNLTRRDLSYWDIHVQNWVMPTEGTFKIRIGASSRDLRVEGEF